MEKKQKKGVARLFEIAGERKGLLILAGILSAGSACCMLVPYLSVYQVANELLQNAGNISQADSGHMIRWGWIAFAGLTGGLLLLYASLMASHIAAFRILYGLRIKLAEHIGRLPLGYLNGTSTGAIKKTMEQNIEKIETFIAHTIPDLVNVLATVVIMFTLFFTLNGWIAAVCLLAIALGIGLQCTMMFGKAGQEFMQTYFDTQEKMSASAVQYVRGMPVVKIFGQSIRSFRQFNKEIEAYKTYALKVCDTYQPGMVVFMVLLNSIVTFILPVGLLILSGQPQNIAFAAVYLFFIILGPGVATPIYKLTFLGSSTKEIDEGVTRLDRIFSEKTMPESLNPQKPHGYDITFTDVSFAYENKTEATRTDALHHINFTARAGEITALVGPSGSGKSTLAKLIARFWDVSAGAVTVGGADIRNLPLSELSEKISYVSQDNFLFNMSLRDNIRIGKPDATDAEVERAASLARCDDFIARFPKGYDTNAGDAGARLSGGERQRLAIARAILKDAPIIILDEATAFTDPENEDKLQQSIDHLTKGKTLIVIAHRLSTIMYADKILMLEDGSISAAGTHEQLLSSSQTYLDMWKAHISAMDWSMNKEVEILC